MAEHTPVHSTEVLSADENREHQAAQTAAQVVMALGALDSRYKENIADYAKELHGYTHKIENATIELKHLYEQKAPHTHTLERLEKEVEYGLRMLEHFTEQWLRKTAVASELEREMNRLDSTDSGVLENRKEDLRQLLEEIEELELSLLKNELERQNTVLRIEPIDQKIRALEKKIQELEAQKRYMESAHLHQISQVAAVTPPRLTAVDTDKED
jgi:chromosome segregation ATPase